MKRHIQEKETVNNFIYTSELNTNINGIHNQQRIVEVNFIKVIQNKAIINILDVEKKLQKFSKA